MGNTWSGNCGSPVVYEATGCGCGSGTSSDVGTKLWVMDQLTCFLANNKPVDYSVIIDDIGRRLGNAEDGVHTTATHIITATSNIATLETTVASNWQDNRSAILDLRATMATKIDTTAVTGHVQQSLFGGNVDSYVTSLITTYAAANLTFASDYAQLVAKFNTQQTTLTSLDQVVSGMFTQWNGVGTPKIGQFKYIGNVLYQYLGGTFGPNNDGWVRADNGAKDDAAQALAWAGGATKFITDPDGKITGWSFADGSGVRSQFDIYADDFRITDGTGSYTPFSIVGGVATFTGKVLDTGGNSVPTGDGVAQAINNNTTTIDGSKLTAGTVEAATFKGNCTTKSTTSSMEGYEGLSTVVDAYAPACWCAVGGQGRDYGLVGIATTENTTNDHSKYAGVFGYGAGAGKDNTGVLGTTRGKVGVYGLAYTTGIGVLGTSDTGPGVRASSNFGHGIYATCYNPTTRGSHGVFTDTSVYSAGGYYPFTGSHLILSRIQLLEGDIIEVDTTINGDISNVTGYGETTTGELSNKVIGVANGFTIRLLTYALESNLFSEYMDETRTERRIKDEFISLVNQLEKDRYRFMGVNAVGEGQINVCGLNGNITAGDYICSSTLAGKGMKQADDLQHNYTVAKALESITFDTPTQVKMIACTYHCG